MISMLSGGSASAPELSSIGSVTAVCNIFILFFSESTILGYLFYFFFLKQLPNVRTGQWKGSKARWECENDRVRK